MNAACEGCLNSTFLNWTKEWRLFWTLRQAHHWHCGIDGITALLISSVSLWHFLERLNVLRSHVERAWLYAAWSSAWIAMCHGHLDSGDDIVTAVVLQQVVFTSSATLSVIFKQPLY